MIELLTGLPHYYHLSDVTACFALCKTDVHRLQKQITSKCHLFLRSCFTKDVNAWDTTEEFPNRPCLRHIGGSSVAGDTGSGFACSVPPEGHDFSEAVVDTQLSLSIEEALIREQIFRNIKKMTMRF